jgi:hypothetical protein
MKSDNALEKLIEALSEMCFAGLNFEASLILLCALLFDFYVAGLISKSIMILAGY